ncbi:MAG TPA: choice-of-anchor J domain-containing protein [Chitinophagaceae bacterium]|nr:choice-of-anchor J domain-containing protein [Chitinophagaceae bacterium]HMZ45998.1 choice-of-anchor J domain-containing protein [Chitinophagaceae bacterium]HNE93730.1 choice-of-anchor J domain-containing protein [Chitinophagaceae bacterium]HNF29404.1 choice-of-anchor J domain-containing protein [Chitinophagaceae bacterium]HNM33670.1 choice-of-anchor J domain-containing protein [Chitinophagaceae bacterium]
MKKIYPGLLAVVLFYTLTANAQVNYTYNAYQSTYVHLEDGITPALDNPTPVGYYEDDEGFANQIPIGFTFNFNNTNYTHLNINVNGFVTFGSNFTMNVGSRYSTNNLMNGPMQENIRPIIAPLWDDLRLKNNKCLSYAVKGNAPNRIFIVQWDSASWNYNLLDPAISFQMILHEGTNKVQFIYKALEGKLSDASASVGIATCSSCTGSFLSVTSIDKNAQISGLEENKYINSLPTTGTLIEFEPGKNELPSNVMVNAYNTHEITLSWNTSAIAEYDYAITTSPLQPLTFSTTNTPSATLQNLEKGKQYYLHVRTSTAAGKSGWVSIPAKTASYTTLPYVEKFEGISIPNNPEAIHIANPLGGNSWQTIAVPGVPAFNYAISYKGDNINNADAWFMLPAMQLTGGLTYRLQFKYRASDSLGGDQKLEVKIGKMMNNGMIGWQTIYKNVKINQLKFQDISKLFAAPTSDEYFIAFRCFSEKSNTAIWIDDIDVSKVKPLPIKMIAFSGFREGFVNKISWQTSAEFNNSSFELQRSSDGKNFTSINKIETKANNGTSSTTLNYSLIDNTPNTVDYYRLKVTDKESNDFYVQDIIKISSELPFLISAQKTYPNPATNVLNTVVYSKYKTVGIIKIMDNYGHIVKAYSINIEAGDNIIQTDISQFNRGMYFVKVENKIGKAGNAKSFIKQ